MKLKYNEDKLRYGLRSKSSQENIAENNDFHFLRCIPDIEDDKEGTMGMKCKVPIAYSGTECYLKELV